MCAKIIVVDYGMGNIASIKNMYKYLGHDNVILSGNAQEIADAQKIILPGVGSFDHGMEQLRQRGLLESLNTVALTMRKPVLGICLGMQLLTKGSEEGLLPGLGWIPAYTRRFSFLEKRLKIPHMGWNYINVVQDNELISGNERKRFYFVHSYYVQCEDKTNVIATCNYGHEFHCAIRRGSIWGVQFHPEKSHKFGMSVLQSFAEL